MAFESGNTVTQAESQSEKLAQKIFRKWESHALAHFYLLTGPRAEQRIERGREFLASWTRELLVKFLAHEYNCSLERAGEKLDMGHSDILWIAPQEKGSYTLKSGELEELFRSQNFRPIELKTRFAVVEDAHLINTYLTNKLLKTLEEPSPNSTLIFLNPSQSELLPTLESRAVKVSLARAAGEIQQLFPAQTRVTGVKDLDEKLGEFLQKGNRKSFGAWENYATKITDFLKKRKNSSENLPLAQLVDELNISSPEDERSFLSFALEIEAHKAGNFAQKSKLLEELKFAENSRLFYNSRRTRIWQQLSQLFTFTSGSRT